MKITKRKYQQAFNLIKQLSEQGLTTVKYFPKGDGVETVETELIKRGSAITFCAKEFSEDESNVKLQKDIEKKQRQLGRLHASKDKDKVLLYEKNAKGEIIGYQFTAESQEKYEDELDAFLSETIDFSQINLYICPKEDIGKEIPFELQPLNGLILNHAFWKKVDFKQSEATDVVVTEIIEAPTTIYVPAGNEAASKYSVV